MPSYKNDVLSKRLHSMVLTGLVVFGLIVPGAVRAQTQAVTQGEFSRLSQTVQRLNGRLSALEKSLEKFNRSIICGRMDVDLIQEGAYIYPLSCSSIGDQPSDVKKSNLKVTLSRPGVFTFEFNPPRHQKPIVLATASKTWGDIPVQAPIVRVSDISASGFTVETFDTAQYMNPTSVGFFFVILGE